MSKYKQRINELAGTVRESSGSANLERVLKKLEKKGVMKSGDIQYVLSNVWAVEPRSVADMDDFLNGGTIGDEPQWPAEEIFKAYRRDVKASTRRPKY